MKKINGLVLSTLTAALLVGCGGGGSSSGTPAGTTSTSTDVTVERGAVYGATVTDSKGQVATQIIGKNVYTFATTPVYPITASGGIIDVDDNGIDEGDIELTTSLTSYSKVITPITDYLGDTTTESGKAKLAKLKEISGITDENDLITKVASELSTEVLIMTNTLYDLMNDGDTSNDDFLTDYENSEFKTTFAELKIEAEKYTDKQEMAKALEEKVITNLGLTKLKTKDLATTTSSTTLKVADLKRYVNYESYESYSYSDSTFADGKITFKEYGYDWNSDTKKHEWTLDSDNDIITYTPDATNPYRLSYVDPISKEEGTFTILSTKKVANYSDLYKTEAKIVVTKKATELVWDKWDWSEPSYWENNKEVKVTDITGLVKMFTVGNYYLGLYGNTYVFFASDGTMVNGVKNESDSYVKGSTIVGSWKQEGDYVVATIGTEIRYFKVGSENSVYYITEAEMREVGYVMSEIMYTGTSLDELIVNIKAPAPEFTSDSFATAVENQTSTTYTATVSDTLKVTYSLSGTDAEYFNIDSATGVVTFKTAPDYESTAHNNNYNFTVKAKNSLDKSSTQYVTLMVTNVDEGSSASTPVEPTHDATTFSKSDLVGKKIFVGGLPEALFFEDNRVVLVNYVNGFTTILSSTILTYTTIESNKIVLSNGYIIEKLSSGGIRFTLDANTVEVELAINYTFTQDELNIALADVIPETSFISGKTVTVSNDDGQVTANFNANGTYSESYGDGTCTGKWKDLGSNKIGVTCEDAGTTAIPDSVASQTTNILQFESSTPAVNDSLVVNEPSKNQYFMTIISINNISYSGTVVD